MPAPQADRVPRSAALRLPDFFIVGHPKCGTTALYEMLGRHPQIYLPALKEPEFLAPDMRQRFPGPMSGPLPETVGDYAQLFAPAGGERLAGEASTFYLTSTLAPEEIAALNPAAKIVAIFREPSDFLRSLHLQLLQNHIEDRRELATALKLEAARLQGRAIPARSSRPQALLYRSHLRYTDQLERFHRRFPQQQVLVLIYEEVRADSLAAVRQILRFLELDDSLPLEEVHANPSVLLRRQRLDRAVHAISVGRGGGAGALKRPITLLLPQGARRRLLRTVRRKLIAGAPPSADAELMRQVRGSARAEVERFGEYIGRDMLELWGYDDR